MTTAHASPLSSEQRPAASPRPLEPAPEQGVGRGQGCSQGARVDVAGPRCSTFQSQQMLLLGLINVHGASLHPDGPKRCGGRKQKRFAEKAETSLPSVSGRYEYRRTRTQLSHNATRRRRSRTKLQSPEGPKRAGAVAASPRGASRTLPTGGRSTLPAFKMAGLSANRIVAGGGPDGSRGSGGNGRGPAGPAVKVRRVARPFTSSGLAACCGRAGCSGWGCAAPGPAGERVVWGLRGRRRPLRRQGSV